MSRGKATYLLGNKLFPDAHHSRISFIGPDHQYVFRTLNSKGPTGPNSTSGYIGTILEGKVNLSDGVQIWSVPVTGNYVIEVSGASGANGTDETERIF